METRKLYQRSKMFNTMISMYGPDYRMTRKEALIAVLITNGVINSPEEYDWREHRGYYSVAFSAYGCDHFYRPVKGNKTFQEDPRYLMKDTDENGKTTYTISDGYPLWGDEVVLVRGTKPQPKKIKVNTPAAFALGTADSPVTEIPKTGNTGEQTQYETNQYIETLLSMYETAVRKGDMKLADLIHRGIQEEF